MHPADTIGRQRRLHLRLPPDLHDRRRGQGRLRGGAGAAAVRGSAGWVPRWSAARSSPPTARWSPDLVDVLGDDVDRGDRGVAAPADRPRWIRRPARATRTCSTRFAAHRAVVDVDMELGLVKVVELDCAQDVGKAMNPQAVVGQIHGGSPGPRAGGDGGDPGLRREGPEPLLHRLPDPDHPGHPADAGGRAGTADPHAPYGLRGVGEPPTISSTPAIVAAIRAATGLALTRVPVRPEHLTGYLRSQFWLASSLQFHSSS